MQIASKILNFTFVFPTLNEIGGISGAEDALRGPYSLLPAEYDSFLAQHTVPGTRMTEEGEVNVRCESDDVTDYVKIIKTRFAALLQ